MATIITIEDLLSAFQALNGETVQEKRRHFNKYLEVIKSNLKNPDDINSLLNLISPQNVLDEAFKIEIMIAFQKNDLLLSGIKSGNSHLIAKVLKNWNLFEKIFSNITPHDFVFILSHLSYSLKLKLLNGIRKNIKNENMSNEYYIAVEKKYGLKIAMMLLPGCTVNLIKMKLEEYHIKFTNKQLLCIIKRDKHFLEFYFDILEMRDGNRDFLKHHLMILKYLSKVDTDLYWRLNKKYQFGLKFGKHSTSRMLQSKEVDIKSDWAWVFNVRKTSKTLQKENDLCEFFLLKLSSESHEKFNDTVFTYATQRCLNFLPKFQQYQVIMNVFSKKYGLNLLDYPKYCSEDFLKVIPLERREIILNSLVKENDQLIYLYKPSKAIPILKEKVKHTSDMNARAYLVQQMYKTCETNGDKQTLLEVLEYTLNRHQNEINLLGLLLNCIMQWPNIINYDSRYWKYFHKMAKIVAISKKEYQGNNFYIKYIYHLIEYNQPFEEVCKEYIKHIFKNVLPYSGLWCFGIENKKYEKQFIEMMANCLKLFKDYPRYQMLCFGITKYLNNYNSRRKATVISLNEYDHLIEEVKASDSWESYQIIRFGCRHYQDELWHDLIWKRKEIDCVVLSWYIKNRPDKLKENIEKLLTCLEIDKIEVFLKKLKKSMNNDIIIEKIKMHALSMLHSGDYEKAKSSIKILSTVVPESLAESVSLLLPNSEISIKFAESKEKLSFQKTIIRYLHKIPDSQVAFPLILKYCTNDYLRVALPPLYAVAYITSEIHIKDYLLTLVNKTVSVRKHVLILGRHLFASEDFVKVLKEMGEKRNNNSSMKSIILKKNIQALTEYPSEFLWILFNKNIKLIDKNNTDIYKFLMKFNKIPLEYLPNYIQVIFEEISQNPNIVINKHKFDILEAIPINIISKLNTEFLKRIIAETATLETELNFHWKCVFYAQKDEQEILLAENFNILKQYIEQNPPDIIRNIKARCTIKQFLNRFLNIILNVKRDNDLLEKFIINWSSIFDSNNLNLNYILIEFTNLYYKSNFDIFQTGVKINALLNEYINKFSCSIINYFYKSLDQFLNMSEINKDEQKLFEFINGLFHNKIDSNTYIIAMHFLPKQIPTSGNASYKYVSIFEEIEKCTIPIIQFHFNVYLSSCRT